MIEPRNHHLWYCRVGTVHNGSNIMVSMGVLGFKVRLAGIAIPQDREVQRLAKEYLMSNILGRWVGLEFGPQQWDKYSRNISIPWYGPQFSRNLCQELVDRGLAVEQPLQLNSATKLYHPREIFEP